MFSHSLNVRIDGKEVMSEGKLFQMLIL